MSHQTITLQVPAGLKTRWVAQANRRGQKLGAFIVDKMSQATAMQTHPISANTLATQYHGSGLALAAIDFAGVVVALAYVDDIAPPEVADAIAESSTHAAFFARQWLKTADGQQHAVRLGAAGEPVLGMCSATEFVRL